MLRDTDSADMQQSAQIYGHSTPLLQNTQRSILLSFNLFYTTRTLELSALQARLYSVHTPCVSAPLSPQVALSSQLLQRQRTYCQ